MRERTDPEFPDIRLHNPVARIASTKQDMRSTPLLIIGRSARAATNNLKTRPRISAIRSAALFGLPDSRREMRKQDAVRTIVAPARS